MILHSELKRRIFSIENEEDFRLLTMEIFRYQSKHNVTFSEFLRRLGKKSEEITEPEQIPFLPISLFKSTRIISSESPEKPVLLEFQSSGTTDSARSTHYILDPEIYRESLYRGFYRVFGDPDQYVFLALLPSYQENPRSSLIYMVNELMARSGDPLSGYFSDYEQLNKRISECRRQNKRIFLWGVTYALLQFAGRYKITGGDDMIILETGGMKGHGKEMIREELHEILLKSFGIKSICSEYGMTELLSQAYCLDGTHFHAPPWMAVNIRDIYDPFQSLPHGQSGAINVIDLANIHSCSFIATDDLGRSDEKGFEVLGRIDNSDIRGCNLLM